MVLAKTLYYCCSTGYVGVLWLSELDWDGSTNYIESLAIPCIPFLDIILEFSCARREKSDEKDETTSFLWSSLPKDISVCVDKMLYYED
jgi:hypothetical protein